MTACLRGGLAALACLLPLLGPTPAAQGAPPDYARRWVFARSYMAHASDADNLVALINRSAAAGYNGIVVNDWGFHSLGTMPPSYFDNVRRVTAAAAAAGVELIPSIFPVGNSEGLLKHDPNLAEGLPVVDAPFVARSNGPATLAGGGANAVVNGGFEQLKSPNVPAGFAWQDGAGVSTFIDNQVAFSGSRSLRIVGDNWLGRIVQHVPARPYTCYRVSAWVRTSNLATWAFRINAFGPNMRLLTYNPALVQANQGWTYTSFVFNSLDATSISLYTGLWFAPPGGTVWIDDLQMQELGPVNVLRRPGTPVRVTSADRRTVYQEGRDFEPIVDPLLGREPYAGVYSYNHGAPPIRLTSRSRIRDGQRVLVSWYHPAIIYGSGVTCCLSEPKIFEVMRDQARRVIDLLKPRTILMSHDEIRSANWCKACKDKDLDAGELLAEHIATSKGIIRQIDPTIHVAVWSDMFDPYHNAVPNYYLVDGDFAGAWEGLDPQMTVFNWNNGVMRESLLHFSGLGVRQVLSGYYDSRSIDNFYDWDAAATGLGGVDGFMYTTWENDNSWLEAYGRAIRRQP